MPGEPDHRLGARALLLGVAPDLEEDVPGRSAGGVEALGLGRAGGQRGGVLGRARELHADRVAGALADDARAGEDVGDRPGEPLVGGRGDERGALRDHLARVRGPADAGARAAPRLAVSRTVGAIPCGGTRPLASEITGVRRSARARRGSR